MQSYGETNGFFTRYNGDSIICGLNIYGCVSTQILRLYWEERNIGNGSFDQYATEVIVCGHLSGFIKVSYALLCLMKPLRLMHLMKLMKQ